VSLPSPGTILAGKYRIDRVIGEGGMGVVYEALHLRLKQRVAIKILRPTILSHPEFVGRFEREARAAATLDSPNVAKVLDVDTSPDGLPYMVIEYLEGTDLSDELARRGRLPVQEAVAYVLEACVPIGQAHALGIIHRDLKPSNLFLANKGGERVLKLLDFGISKVLTEIDTKTTSSLATLGTPHYMSPEHVRSSSDVDRRSDIWSLGVILYELLTGTEPYQGDAARVIAAIAADPVPLPRTRRADIPEELERVIMHALEKDPRKRFADVRALAQALAPFAPEDELVTVSAAERLPAALSVAPAAIPAHQQPTVVVPKSDPDTLAGVASRPRPPRWVLPIGGVAAVAVALVAWWALRAAPSREVSRAEATPSVTVVAAPPASVVAPPTAPSALATEAPAPPASGAPRPRIEAPRAQPSSKPATAPSFNPLVL